MYIKNKVTNSIISKCFGAELIRDTCAGSFVCAYTLMGGKSVNLSSVYAINKMTFNMSFFVSIRELNIRE